MLKCIDMKIMKTTIKKPTNENTFIKHKLFWIVLVVAVIISVLIITQIGFYTVQPIGALPDGVTLLIWRNSDEPFFNSPDAFSLERTGGVSLFTRALAIKYAPVDRIILKLPYWEFAYLQSTGGIRFEK